MFKMRKTLFLLFTIFLLLGKGIILNAQSQGNRFVSGRVIHTQTGATATKFTVSCNFLDEGGLYDGTNVQVGNILFVSDGGLGYFLPIDSVLSGGPSTVIVRVVKTGLSLGAIPVGIGYISKGSDYLKAMPFVSGLSNANQQISIENTIQLLDSVLQYRLPTRTIGGTSPAYTPTSADAWIAQNGIGELYTYNGSVWTLVGLPSLADGKVWVGNASNIPVAVTLSQDATISNTGVVEVKSAKQVFGITNVVLISNGTDNVTLNGSNAIVQPFSPRDITGIAYTGGNAGKLVFFRNIGTAPATLKNNNTGSLAINRFSIGSDYPVNPGKGVILTHDGGTWGIVGIGESTGGAGITDGDKGDIDVTSSGTVWTIDTSAITNIKIAANAIDSAKIAQRGISMRDIAPEGAITGQVLKYSGNMWLPSTDAGITGSLCLDTITQTSHGFRKMDAVLDTSSNATPKYIKGNTSSSAFLPSHLVVDSLSANTFVIQSCGYFTGTQTRFTTKQVYYLNDGGTYSSTPDEQYNYPVFGISSSNTILYLRLDGSMNPYITGLITETGTSRTLSLADIGNMVLMNNGATNTLTVPLNSSVAFSIGTQIDVTQLGAGQTVIAATGGVTINAPDAADRLRVQYSTATLTKIAINTWLLSGDITN